MSGNVKPLFGTPLNRAHPLAQGLVGSWLLNENSGNKAYDTSGCENHGTLTNFANPPTATSGWCAGPHGGALKSDGIDDYIDCGNNPSLGISTGPFTVILNVEGTYKALSGLMGKKRDAFTLANPGWAIQYAASPAKLYVAVSNGTTQALQSVNLDTFPLYQVGIIRRNDNKIGYIVNGSMVLTSATIAGDITSVYPLEFQRGYRFGYVYSTSVITSAYLYNRALSAEEVAYLNAFPYCMYDTDPFPGLALLPRPKASRYYRGLMAGGI